MEKKKLLLVAISVGVFLVIVIGASILVFSPRSPSPAAAASGSARTTRPIPAGNPQGTVSPDSRVSVNPTELAKKATEPQKSETSPDEDRDRTNVFYIYGEVPSEVVTVDRGTGNRLTVDVPRPATAAVPDEAPRARPAPAKAPQAPAAAPPAHTSPATKVATPKAVTPKAAAPKTAAPQKAAPKASSPAKSPDNYWVQTGSFSTLARAEAVKDTLSDKGITSLIENRAMEEKTYFRVRVGPYTSKNEADYWLALIRSIHGFEESQVWKAPARL
jgi:DedD protein